MKQQNNLSNSTFREALLCDFVQESRNAIDRGLFMHATCRLPLKLLVDAVHVVVQRKIVFIKMALSLCEVTRRADCCKRFVRVMSSDTRITGILPSAVIVEFYLKDTPFPPLLFSPFLPFVSLPFFVSARHWGPGACLGQFLPFNCSQVSFDEFWVLNSKLFWSGVFVHTNFFEPQGRAGRWKEASSTLFVHTKLFEVQTRVGEF